MKSNKKKIFGLNDTVEEAIVMPFETKKRKKNPMKMNAPKPKLVTPAMTKKRTQTQKRGF